MFLKPPHEGPRYAHMAIHPYPVELESQAVLRDGSRVAIRPIRPEDAELETRFFERLSERSRYQRFMHQLPRLTPRMLARFTQLDYDRELALVALFEREFVAVGRYAPNSDGNTAEFALVVADAWQGKGLGRLLLEKLRVEARKSGYRALYGNIMQANHGMLDLALRLGFEVHSREGSDVTVVSRL
jgi:acetyltransferase